MHPIEHLRYVARSTAAPQDLLIVESARALASFHDDPAGLVTACRRVLSRQITAGGLWWLCSTVLCSPDPLAAAWDLSERVEDDTMSRELAMALDPDSRVLVVGWPVGVIEALAKRGSGEVFVVDAAREGHAAARYLDGHGVDVVSVDAGGIGAAVGAVDIIVLEATAMSSTHVLATAGSLAAAAVARQCETKVWLAVSIGRVLPTRVWDALIGRWQSIDDAWELPDEIVAIELIDAIIGSNGKLPRGDVVSLIDCPIAPELFKADIT